MNKKMSKRQKNIKTKLMAAICMLLVSSIMMVSTTYAWFTLSTAPEVTGIQTAVGANGNLEIALQRYDGNSANIVSTAGDSTKDIAEKNVTWGNIVDVSDDNIYGLSYITLYPARLNTETGGENLALSPLSTPTYGSDGRVAALRSETITGVYSAGSFYEGYGTIEKANGVRAVGIASGMTARQLAYRQALASASSADGQARRAASNSLNTNGSALADIAINHALYTGSADDEKYSNADVAVLQAIVDGLLGTENTTGSLEYIENALRQYMLANALASADDSQYLTIKETIETAEDLSDIPQSYWTSGMKGTDGTDGYVAKLEAAITAAENADEALSKLTDDDHVWDDIYGAMKYLVTTNGLLINNMTVNDVMADKGAVASSIMKNGLNLTMAPGSGVFADIADFCGDYSAGIMIARLTYGDIDVDNVEATMQTATQQNPVYLKAANNQVPAYGGGNTSAAKPISDFYGYIIDLAFRTNAAESYLQLQAEAANRIYAGNENEAIMGGGASMTFAPDTDSFHSSKVEELMKAIRIVFFETDTRKIIGYARLDHLNAVDNPDGSTTMELMLTDASGNAKVDDTSTTNVDESIAIMALNQNAIHELSVLVYLDGDSVQNDDVAYDAATSMSGTMNLQFSSSANLDPMDYTDLLQDNGATEPAKPVSVKIADITDNYSAIVYHYDGKVGAIVLDADGNEYETGKLTINNVAATYATFNGKGGWIIDAETAPASVVIKVGADPVYTVTGPNVAGVSYTSNAAQATKGKDFTFSLTNNTATEYTVTYKVGATGTAQTLTNLSAKGETATATSYTIPASAVTDVITITITPVTTPGE